MVDGTHFRLGRGWTPGTPATARWRARCRTSPRWEPSRARRTCRRAPAGARRRRRAGAARRRRGAGGRVRRHDRGGRPRGGTGADGRGHRGRLGGRRGRARRPRRRARRRPGRRDRRPRRRRRRLAVLDGRAPGPGRAPTCARARGSPRAARWRPRGERDDRPLRRTGARRAATGGGERRAARAGRRRAPGRAGSGGRRALGACRRPSWPPPAARTTSCASARRRRRGGGRGRPRRSPGSAAPRPASPASSGAAIRQPRPWRGYVAQHAEGLGQEGGGDRAPGRAQGAGGARGARTRHAARIQGGRRTSRRRPRAGDPAGGETVSRGR